MNIRADVLCCKLDRLLQRYSPPRGMEKAAQDDETEALLRAIDRHAPRSDYEGWWSRFEDVLLEGLTTRAWPTVGDIAKAAAKVPRPESALSDAHDWREFAAQKQLREWLVGEGYGCPPQFITRERLYAIGAAPELVASALAFAANPDSRGSTDPATLARGRNA